MKKILGLLMGLFITLTSFSQDTIRVKNNVFEVLYSQNLEQPLWIKYRSTNRPTNVNRGSMDFYTEKTIKTSDAADYLKNIYDKGHGAPAATFSDNMENLKQTFSYLNCILQDQYLNRGEWRLLEEQERKWDDNENLTILIKVFFDKPVKRVSTNAAIPSYLQKHIYFEKQNKWKCYVFLNEKPKFKWDELEMICKDSDHR
jgi:endonuclease G